MAKDPQDQEPQEQAAAESRKPTEYSAFRVNPDGTLAPLPSTVAVGQQAAKKNVAVALASTEQGTAELSGEGVTIVVVPAKSFQPELVRIAVPAPRVTIGG